ncbi:MAG TPA: type I 3-dehydroquinate dehydratase [Candidatus Salinicoccus merdavium]|nr:type I 3-dehydroquinate dehydratase [Candidatus Salinicoccus merdavium]
MNIKNIEICEGLPKVVVSISGTSLADIQKEIVQVKENIDALDIVEIRSDAFDNMSRSEHLGLVNETCSELSELPIIYTYRTSHEGGSGSKSYAEYKDLLMDVITKCDIDIVDIEFVTGGKVLSDIVDCADEHGKTVLLSHHNFKETLRLEEMQKLLYNMHSAGGEILKLAFAPNDADDVVNMLKIVKMGKEALGNKVIGISMGELGKMTRLAGGEFGSCLTYGYITKNSAPGQVHAARIKGALKAYEN